METRKNLREGMSLADARRRARLAFGGSEKVKEEVRDARGTRPVEKLAQDVGYGLDYPSGVDYWTPVGPGRLPGYLFDVVARLAPGTTPPGARSEFLAIVQRLDREDRVAVNRTGAAVQTLSRAMLGDTRQVLVALSVAVALLLLIACVNIGSLVLLRADFRVREIVVRRALGASNGQIARLLLVESALLGLLGGVFGLACAEGLLRVLLFFAPVQLPRLDVIRLTGTPFSIAGGITLFAVLLVGLLPALTAGRGNLALSLRPGSRSGSQTRTHRRVRQALVASQMAVAVVMLAGAGLLVRSLQRLERLDLGYDTDHLSIIQLSIPFVEYDTQPRLHAAFAALYGRLRAVPGVTALTPILVGPFQGAHVWLARPALEGQSPSDVEANPWLPIEAGGSEFFRTFRIPILRGRGFTDSDREDSPKVVVVSEALAGRFWPGQDPIGQRLRFPGTDGTEWRTVVGVAGDIRFRRLRDPTPTIFLPWRQSLTQGYFAVRTRDDLASVLPAMRRIVRDFDPQLGVWHAATMDDYLAGPLAQPRLSTFLLSGFGLMALLLAATGLYGVMASLVRERTHDLGVRVALGATPERLRREVLANALRVTAVGAVIGLGGALVGSRLLRSLLFEVSPTDPVTLAGVCILLLAVALLAAYLPALRATRIDPMHALRGE